MSTDLIELSANDAPRAARLHAAAFDKPWSAAALAEIFSLPGTLAMGVETDADLRAFISIQIVGDEGDIQTLAVQPASRRQGLASKLLLRSHDVLGQRGVKRIMLDVAEDNHAARALYSALGYRMDGKRPGYYRRGPKSRIDAVLMSHLIERKY